MSNFVQCYDLQHARFTQPSLCPRVCSASWALSQWFHSTIWSSVARFSSFARSFPGSGLFQWVGSLHQVAKVLELQPHHQSFQSIFRVDFLQVWLVWSPCCPRDSQESFPAPHFESVNSSALNFVTQLSHLYMTTRKTIALTIQTFVGKVMYLLLNTSSRFVIAFLPKSKCLLISWLQ